MRPGKETSAVFSRLECTSGTVGQDAFSEASGLLLLNEDLSRVVVSEEARPARLAASFASLMGEFSAPPSYKH